MNGMQLPLRTEAYEVGKLSAAEVVGHEVRKAINGFRSASFDVSYTKTRILVVEMTLPYV
jgi:hypothetical protein